MAVTLATDIVADVMRAATPERLQAAQARLRSLAAGGAEAAARSEASPSVGQKFEAMVLGTFFQNMLPDEADSVFGGGLSGDMWKSILAQHLGEAVAARGGIGVASRYLADSYAEGDASTPLRGAADLHGRAPLDAQNTLSRGLIQELERKVAGTLTGETSVKS